jgi:hypothetical protein
MTYHLGPIDPDRRPELFADPRDGEPQPRPRRVLATALALLVMGLFGGGLWFAYVQGTRHAGGGDAPGGSVPLIRADERPTKVKPEKPGGMEIPDRDKLIYNPTRPVVEHLLPPPEKPLPRPAPPLPSPSPQREQPLATASNTPASPPTPPPAAIPQAQQSAAVPASKPPQAQAAPPKTAATGAAGARLQLGSVRSEDAARQEWERIKRKNTDLLGTLSVTPIRADLGDKGIYYRILTGPVADQAAAERICSELKQRSVGCIVAR